MLQDGVPPIYGLSANVPVATKKQAITAIHVVRFGGMKLFIAVDGERTRDVFSGPP